MSDESEVKLRVTLACLSLCLFASPPPARGLELRTHDGGISLVRVGGSVTGESANGGLHVVLGGERWEGVGLDVRTTNGGVLLSGRKPPE